MAKTTDPTNAEDALAEMTTKTERMELQARYFEAQIRTIEARKKLEALRKGAKDNR
jgi:outer membrane PBP1 activator LpoA protein